MSDPRPATVADICTHLPHLSINEVIAIHKAKICFVAEDGTFILNNLQKVQSIIIEKTLREL